MTSNKTKRGAVKDDGSHAAPEQDVPAATPPRGVLSFVNFFFDAQRKVGRGLQRKQEKTHVLRGLALD